MNKLYVVYMWSKPHAVFLTKEKANEYINNSPYGKTGVKKIKQGLPGRLSIEVKTEGEL